MLKTHSKVEEEKKRERKGEEMKQRERETERERFAEIDGYDGCGWCER